MSMIEKLDDNSLQAICDVIGDTSLGLTGTEIGRLLNQQNISDIEPMITKRRRLFVALSSKQTKDRCANNIFAFIQVVMDPVRYASAPHDFSNRLSELNVVLSMRGFEIRENGQIHKIDKVQTLPEAQRRARQLGTKLRERNVHQEVLDNLLCRI